MRSFVFGVILSLLLATSIKAAGLANRQSLPECVTPCMSTMSTLPSSCEKTDVGCRCNDGNILKSLVLCLNAGCPAADSESAGNYLADFCKNYAVQNPLMSSVLSESLTSTTLVTARTTTTQTNTQTLIATSTISSPSTTSDSRTINTSPAVQSNAAVHSPTGLDISRSAIFAMAILAIIVVGGGGLIGWIV